MPSIIIMDGCRVTVDQVIAVDTSDAWGLVRRFLSLATRVHL